MEEGHPQEVYLLEGRPQRREGCPAGLGPLEKSGEDLREEGTRDL
jgi:hypothetical protein